MMDPAMMDMIMSLRGRSISDTRILRAMESVTRRAFVPPQLQDKAYHNQDLPIACGQSLSNPFTVAVMSQMLEVKPEHKLLEIGTGSGYHSAVLSKLTKRVYSVERYKQLIAEAETRLRELGIYNIVIRHGDGRYGWKGQAPYDRIIVTCGLIAAPEMLLDQLAPSGILIATVDGQLTKFSKARSRISETILLPLSLPMIESGKSKSL